MNGVHDMGGMHGFGPIVREAHEPLFHAEWETRVFAIDELVQVQGYYNIDEFRYGIEQMPPAAYLRASYYERWLATAEYNLIRTGVLTRRELDARTELLRRDPATPLPPPATVKRPSPAPIAMDQTPAPPARFAVGDQVIVRNDHPQHHTRMPRYTRGKRGVVQLVHAPEILPDTNAHGLGEQQQTVYNVRFAGRELWGQAARPNETVNIDLWERYLEPAPRSGDPG